MQKKAILKLVMLSAFVFSCKIVDWTSGDDVYQKEKRSKCEIINEEEYLKINEEVNLEEENDDDILEEENKELDKKDNSPKKNETENENEDKTNKTNEVLIPKSKERAWNILIYMPADNNLETSALEDINEMEFSNLDTDVVSVFILLDRSNAYNTSEKNWSGTRLYRLETGKKPSNKQMISEEMNCVPLGLEVGKDIELDMSSDYVLSNCLSYLRKKYPADRYGLVMWGHGTGWRSELDDDLTFSQLTKGFAYDENSKTYMSLVQLGTALKNALPEKKLDLLGFDTCFGGEFEVVYELKDYADYIIGSEGLVMSSGWNYTNIFNEIENKELEQTCDICECIVNQFSNEYLNTGGASIVAVKSEKIDDYFKSFDDYMYKTADLISRKKIRDDLLGIIFTNKNCDTQIYTYGTENCDVYVDVYSLVNNCYSYFENTYEEQLYPYYEKFVEEKEKCICYSWSYDSDDNSGNLGVFFSTLTSGNLLSTLLPLSYTKGKTMEQIQFVKNSDGYVPTLEGNSSFLDKLFYTNFN